MHPTARSIACFALCATAACGGGLDAAAAATVWEGLHAAYVARPLDLGYFRDGGLFTAPTACAAGSAESSVVHTHAFSKLANDDSGALTGFIQYSLRGCRGGQLQFDGMLRRGVHGVLRQEPEGATAQRMTDVFFGTLDVGGAAHGRCVVDLTRRIVDGAEHYEGTLCGHAADKVIGPR